MSGAFDRRVNRIRQVRAGLALEAPVNSPASSRFLLLQRCLDAAGANCAPTDPCLKGAEQSDQNKDCCEEGCLRDETAPGQEKNDRDAAAGSAAFAVNILLHPGSDAGFNYNTN